MGGGQQAAHQCLGQGVGAELVAHVAAGLDGAVDGRPFRFGKGAGGNKVFGIDGRKRLFVHRHLARSCRHASVLSAAENPARPPS